MTTTPGSPQPIGSDRGRRIGNLLLFALAGTILLQGIISVVSHRSNAEWLTVWQRGTAEEQLLALQILANRSKEFKVRKDLIRKLLSSADPRLRDFAFSPTIVRFQVRLQRRHLEAAQESPERLRQDFFLHYRPGPRRTMKLNDLRRYLDSLEQAPSDHSHHDP